MEIPERSGGGDLGKARAVVDHEPSVGRSRVLAHCDAFSPPSAQPGGPALEGQERERDTSLPASQPATEGA